MTPLERSLTRAMNAHVAVIPRCGALTISITFLVFAALTLLGCGLTVNSTAGSGSSQSAGSGGGSETAAQGGPAGGQTIPPPGALQALTGCANPNTGVASGDFGVGTAPVYTLVDNQTPVVGAPDYASNAIFWTSRENAPGQSILLAGAFTNVTKTVRLALIPAGTIDWETLVGGSSTVIPTTQQGTTGLSFIVPANFPAGVYGFEIQDSSTSPIFGLANAPSLNWAIGVPGATEPAQALQHQVSDCGVEAGGTLRLFGKNFTPSDQVILQSPTGSAYSFKPSNIDATSITLQVPNTLAPGSFTVWVGNSPWDATSSPAAQITINPPLTLSARNVACSTLAGDGVTDDTQHLQSCLDWYAPVSGSKEVAYIAIPAGNFVLTAQVTTHPFEVLIGSSSASTNFIGRPRNLPPVAWFKVSPYFGMANLSLTAPANPNLLLSPGVQTGNPLTSGHLFFSGVNFSSTSDASKGAESMFALAGPDIQVYNSFFLSNSNQVFDINYGDGGIVSGNEIVVNNFTGLGISDSQNIIFEKNKTHSQNTPGQGSGGHSGGSGLSISRGNSQYGQSALSRDIYVGYNTFENMGSNDQQVITNDGDGGSYFGPIASSTATTVTLADDPAWSGLGTTNPQAAVMVIAFGTGVGQYSFLKSYSARTIELSSPWKVLPDTSSVVGIFQYELNMTIAHNTITNTLGASIVLGDALEGVVEDNVLTNSGQGILISAFGPYGGPAALGPVINTDVLRNTLALGAGTLIARDANPYIWGIGIQDFPACLLSGLMVRNNTVPSINVIYNTNGVNGISANVIEQNQAYWQPTFRTPGFLVQDNSPPPP
ncbi:MAG: glycosyl hydrolase family 28-related protein [Acidobacteriaceae bacterium]